MFSKEADTDRAAVRARPNATKDMEALADLKVAAAKASVKKPARGPKLAQVGGGGAAQAPLRCAAAGGAAAFACRA